MGIDITLSRRGAKGDWAGEKDKMPQIKYKGKNGKRTST